MLDYVLCVIYATSYDAIEVTLHIIGKDARDVVAMVAAPCMRRLVDSYALYCARAGMMVRHVLLEHVQHHVDARNALEIRVVGVPTSRLRRIQGTCVTAVECYLAAAGEFFF